MSVTLESVARINALKNGIEATTGETYADLTAGVQALKNGYGQSGGGTEEIENIIDQSGVLDSTDGTATEKVEQLIDKAEDENKWYLLSETFTDLPRFSNLTFEKLPRMNPIKATSFSYKFSFMPNLKRVDFYINSESCTRFDNCFAKCTVLEYVKGINTANATNFSDMFSWCTSLKTIEEPLNFSNATSFSGCFYGCTALQNIRSVPETIKKSISIPSPVLSDESIQSIIDGLADLTGGTAQTLTLNATVKAKLTETQLATITGKNWNVA